MSSKTLTAKVKFDTKSAESALKRLETKIKSIDKVLNNRSGKKGLEQQIDKAVIAQEKLRQATLKTKLAEERLATQKEKTALAAQRVKNATDQANKSAQGLSRGFTSAKSSANGLLLTVKRLAGAYLGVQTAKLGINTSDTITSAQNRLNNIEGGNPEQTAKSMDKIYAASQRARTGYSDMLSNVSKTMTLAGDSFQGNIDNAIRFQEIMAKAYTVGGASATEQATSMYQLVQALGSGILQGDELRSVREGAPIAYKEIEKFAQGVFNTEESLTDMASQGVITSDIIVAAIMNSEEKINESFNNTKMTFAQAWTSIKNMAIKAFEPALESLNQMLNGDAGRAMIEGIGNALVLLGKTVSWLFNVMKSFLDWCVKNWSWLKYVVIAIIVTLISFLVYFAAVSIATAIKTAIAWMIANWQLVLIIGVIATLVTAIVWLANTVGSGCEFIIYALLLVGAAMILVGICSGSMALIVIGIILLLAGLFLMFAQQIVGAVYWAGAVITNIGLGVANFFIALWNSLCAIWNNVCAFFVNLFMGVAKWISALWNNCVAAIVNVAMGLWNSIQAIAQNIGIAFENAWIGAQNCFWGFIAAVLKGIKWLEPAINAVAKVFGVEGFTLSGVISDVESKQKSYKSFVSVGNAWNKGMNTRSYQDLGDAWSSGWNTKKFQSVGNAWDTGMNTYQYKDLDKAYAQGAQVGANIQNKVGEWGQDIKDKITGITGSLGNGVDIGELTGTGGATPVGSAVNGLPNPNDPAHSLGNAYDPSGAADDIANGVKKLGDIDDNTGDMADAMALAEEDIEYLRKLADMEWKKEYTTASIKVDMSNYNTVNGESDLDGIVTKLSELLYEEMNSVANGVYA